MQYKRHIMLMAAGLVLGAIVIGFLFWLTSPRRPLNAFLNAVEDGKQSAALSYVSDTIKTERRDNIDFFLDDWTGAQELTTSMTEEESWRTRGATSAATEEESEESEGRVEQIPTPKYWAHHYEARVTLSFDGYEDPVIIKLKRQAENEASLFAQLFRGWKITRIKYQPISDEELDVENFEIDTGELNEELNQEVFEEFDDEEFELDEEGNVLPSDDEATGEDESTPENVNATENANEAAI